MEITNFPETVLVVDDEPVVVQVLEKILTLRGMEVKSAGTAEQALEKLRVDGFGCLLADKNLPGMNGIELVAQARKLQPHCACIVMTAYASTASAVEALRLGATDYLEKPFQEIELVAEKVRLAIQHHRDAFERNRLIRRLREFQEELNYKEGQVEKQRSEIEMFNQILEMRVAVATKDLEFRCSEYEKKLAAGATPRDGEIVGAEMALMILEDIQLRPGAQFAAVRGDLQRVVRQLQNHLKLLRGGGSA